jgi:alkylresorcinol/alkylpyrone synthase
MQELISAAAGRTAATSGFDVEILSVATANPPFTLNQAEASKRAKEVFPRLNAMWPVYENAGIEQRYNCEPIDWYIKPHTWEERTASFQKHALDLFEQVTVKAAKSAGIALSAIDILVTNSVTGLAIPSLDAKLLNRLKLKPSIERLPIFGLGCGGGVGGLARADAVGAGDRERPRAVSHRRSVQPVPARQRSESGDVRLRGFVW